MTRLWGAPLLVAVVLGISFHPVQAASNWTDPFAASSGRSSDTPTTRTSADGATVITAWRNTSAIDCAVEVRASSNGGVTWSGPQVLSGPGQDVDEFTAAMSADGKTAVVGWDLDTDPALVYVTISRDGGLTWSPPRSLGGSGPSSGNLQLAVSADGSQIVAGWNEDDRNFLDISRDAGATWLPAAFPVSPVGQVTDRTALAMSDDGQSIYVAWVNYTQNPDSVQFARSGNGGRIWLIPAPGNRISSNASPGFDRVLLDCSSDGSRVVALWNTPGPGNSTAANRSEDGGANWLSGPDIAQIAATGTPWSLNMSTDGSRVVAAVQKSDGVHVRPAVRVSSNGGTSWAAGTSFISPAGGLAYGQDLQMSPTGQSLVALWRQTKAFGVSRSSDYGATWVTDATLDANGQNTISGSLSASADLTWANASWIQTVGLGSGIWVSRSAPAPSVSGVSPSSGPLVGGTAVTITGTGFVPGAKVTFGGVPATDVVVASTTTITANTPAASAGKVGVTVTNVDGLAATLSDAFTFVAAPSVSGVSPSSGPLAGGTAVTITGTGFVPGAKVTFGGVPATDVVVASTTTITANTPAASAGKVGVTVTNVDGQSGTLADAFTFVKKAQEPTKPVRFTKKVKPGAWVKVLPTPVTTNAGQRAKVTATAKAKGSPVAKKIFKTRTRKGHFQVRSNGTKKLVVSVRLAAPETADYLAYSARKKYTVKKG